MVVKEDKALFDLLITKHKDWEYENEYRIIRKKGNLLHDLPGKITSVTFGLKTSDDHISEIKKIVLSNYPDIHFKKCVKSSTNFEISAERI